MRTLLATLALVLAGASPALAADPAFERSLPGDASAARVGAAPDTWLVGARPGRAASALARRAGARLIAPEAGGGYVVARGRARGFAAALRRRGLLLYAQPDRYRRLDRVQDDPLSGPPNDWRAVVADPSLDPPVVSPTSPLIALVDARMDETHPEWTGDPFISTLGGRPLDNLHGTATASVAAAPANHIGILGVWPGARALNVPLPDRITCSASAGAIAKAIRAGAAVINMSYGSARACAPEYVALQDAVARGIVPVAAAGNEFDAGNPPEFPASLPHVLTVAAVNAKLNSSAFSNANDAVDLSAPGEGIETAVPPTLDDDGTPDGYERLDGTSFSAPMVSAAVAWIRAARPALAPDQAAQVVRLSARDLGPKGWDRDTGYGLLNVGKALKARAPRHDPLEPNDNIVWVDGRALGAPSTPIYRGKGATRLKALLDAYEDPRDVYRVRIPGHGRARVTVNPSFGNPALLAYAPTATSVASHRIATSHRKGAATERVTLRNRSRKARTFYVAVGIQAGARTLDCAYTLTTKR